MTDAARSDYSWSVPNRRFIDSGLYLPSIRSEGIDTIVVIIDTSGSVPGQTLAEFWAELREVVDGVRPQTVFVLQVDAALRDAAEHTADDLPEEVASRTTFSASRSRTDRTQSFTRTRRSHLVEKTSDRQPRILPPAAPR